MTTGATTQLTKLPVPVINDPSQITALSNLDPQQLAQARQFAQQIDPDQGTSITMFGSAPQREVGKVTDPILKKVATKDVGAAGEVLGALVENVRSLDPSALAKGESFLGSLPIIGPLFSRLRRIISQYESIYRKIEQITVQLETAQAQMMTDVRQLDMLKKKNFENYQQLMLYIAAGELKLEELRDLHGAMLAEVPDGDVMASQKVASLLKVIERLEMRVHDLKLTAMIAVQTVPQIELVQSSDEALADKIQSSILNTIPIWKNQLVIAISLYNQKKALELQRAVTQTTNDLLTQNAQMLRQGTVEVAREVQRGIVEIETLRTVNSNLIGTIEDTLTIQAEGRAKRIAVEQELQSMQRDLAGALVRAQSIR
jgi:uncharacterized protein YaaN involved in tellurite resistance